MSRQKQVQQKNHSERELGQATLEFALSLLLIFGVSFFGFQYSVVSALGSYVQYATFMSARALLSASGSVEQEQQRRAESVFYSTVLQAGGGDRWGGIISTTMEPDVETAQPVFRPQGTGHRSRRGVRYGFEGKIFILPLLGDEESRGLELVSESFLGIEPGTNACQQWLRESDPNADSGNAGRVYDNGC